MNQRQKGFSLVEIMVGLAMGMIAMIVVMQVFTVFEGDKRATTGGADAQTNGAIALYTVERDMKIAGWGMDSRVYRRCNNTFSYCDGSPSCGGTVGPIAGLTMASVLITDGGTGPDAIAAQYFTDPAAANFSFPGSTTLRGTMTGPGDTLNVTSMSGCTHADPTATPPELGDLALVENGGTCTLMRLTPLTDEEKDAGNPILKHESTPTGDYNPPLAYMTANNWPVYAAGSTVACFRASATGPLTQRSYSIDANRQLSRQGGVQNDVVATDIMDLQAEYGILPAGVTDIQWVPPTGAWANPTPANRTLIKAIRIALVARSTQYEKPEDGAACAATTPAKVAAWSTWATFNTTNYPADWQCYRYKAFETVVPLRNIISGDE